MLIVNGELSNNLGGPISRGGQGKPSSSYLTLSSSICLALGACPAAAAVNPTRALGCSPGGGAAGGRPAPPAGSSPEAAAPSTIPCCCCCPLQIALEMFGGDELGKEMAPLLFSSDSVDNLKWDFEISSKLITALYVVMCRIYGALST